MTQAFVAKAAPAANQFVTVGQIPVDRAGSVNITFVNRGVRPAVVSLWMTTDTGDPSDADATIFEVIVAPSDTLVRKPNAVGAGTRFIVRTDTPDTTVRIDGFIQEAAA